MKRSHNRIKPTVNGSFEKLLIGDTPLSVGFHILHRLGIQKLAVSRLDLVVADVEHDGKPQRIRAFTRKTEHPRDVVAHFLRDLGELDIGVCADHILAVVTLGRLFDEIRKGAHVIFDAVRIRSLMPEMAEKPLLRCVALLDDRTDERFIEPQSMTERFTLNAHGDIMYHHLLFIDRTDRTRPDLEADLLADQFLDELRFSLIHLLFFHLLYLSLLPARRRRHFFPSDGQARSDDTALHPCRAPPCSRPDRPDAVLREL